MRDLLEFDDAGASGDEPAKNVTVGDIRAWHDEIERLREAFRHYHKKRPDDDICDACGFDLRNPIHKRH